MCVAMETSWVIMVWIHFLWLNSESCVSGRFQKTDEGEEEADEGEETWLRKANGANGI